MTFDDTVPRPHESQPDLSTRSSLVAGLKEFSEERWIRFALVYTPLLRFWIRRKNVPVAQVDDVLQESFRSICTGIGSFERDAARGTFRGWLRAIVERRVADHFRSQPPEFSIPQDRLANVATPLQKEPEAIESEQQVLEEIRARALELVRRSTTEKTWQMFWMSAVEQHPTAEIARHFGVTTAAVRVAKQRVLQRLRELLVEDFGETAGPTPDHSL